MESSRIYREFERRSEYVCPSFVVANYCSQVKKPSLCSSSQSLYMQSPPQLEEITGLNLDKSLQSLVSDGEEVVITDAKLPFELQFILQFSSGKDLS